MIVQELKGLPHVLTLKDGSTFRIFSREQKTVSDKLISLEFHALQEIGGILLTPEEKKEAPAIKTSTKTNKKEVTKNE